MRKGYFGIPTQKWSTIKVGHVRKKG